MASAKELVDTSFEVINEIVSEADRGKITYDEALEQMRNELEVPQDILDNYALDTVEGKQLFIAMLMNNLKSDLLAKVSKMPAEWDGFELRWLIEEYVSENVVFSNSYYDNRSSRKRKFHNERLVKNI